MIVPPQGMARVCVVRLSSLVTPEAAPDEGMTQCREIRRRVFVEEQSVPPELEWDGLDDEAEHFMAIETAEDERDASATPRAVGTARLRSIDGCAKAERVAVLESHRRHGVGRCLMQALEQRAIERGLGAIKLNAQVRVVPFYERLGYTRVGEVFVEAGIDHLAMSKTLSG